MSYQCFSSNIELRNAVLEYVQPNIGTNMSSNIALKYGYPINNWCVTNVTDFSYIFTPDNSNNNNSNNIAGTTLFNESISNWDMSNAINLTSMFEGAFAFNQDISIWNITNVIDMKQMFAGAYSFNQNICSWGGTLLLQNNNNNEKINVMNAFVDTSCPIDTDPLFNTSSGIPGPFCYPCDGQIVTPSPTIATDNSITLPTNNNNDNNNVCFETKIELELALIEYLQNNNDSTSDVSKKYGYPINNWCVTKITDFSKLFSPINNIDKIIFNEDISNWDMSNAITIESMFENNIYFNQNLYKWNLNSNLKNAYRTFFGTKSFNYNLCLWGQQYNNNNAFIVNTINVTQMFRDTSCPTLLDPIYNNTPYPGPFCYDCTINLINETSSLVFVLTNPPTITPVPMLVPTTSPSVQGGGQTSSASPTSIPRQNTSGTTLRRFSELTLSIFIVFTTVYALL